MYIFIVLLPLLLRSAAHSNFVSKTPTYPVVLFYILQIRLPSGEQIEETFDELDPLSVVAEVVRSKLGSQKFLLSIPYPRRIFTDQDLHDVSIKDAGLAPKGTLIAQLGIAVDMKQDTTPVVKPGVKHVHNKKEYDTLKATPNKLVVVDFSADWCGYVLSIPPAPPPQPLLTVAATPTLILPSACPSDPAR
jgi:thiol-disulfide isomerase/thioredoxin